MATARHDDELVLDNGNGRRMGHYPDTCTLVLKLGAVKATLSMPIGNGETENRSNFGTLCQIGDSILKTPRYGAPA